MNKSFYWFLKLFFLAVFILGIPGCNKDSGVGPSISDSDFQFTGDESAKVNVGLYIDSGVWDGCKTTTKNMLEGMKCNYTVITKDSILNSNLDRYSTLLMPGGDMWQYRDYLGANGMKKIKDYVNRGGGYLGICGGAYFGTNKVIWRGWSNKPRKNISMIGLNLLASDSDGPIEDFAPSYVDSKCKVNIVEKNHAISQGVPDIIEIYYDHGPMFLITNTTGISVIGKSVNGDKTTMIASSYGMGKVFLTGQHPELSDTHISWTLLKNAIKWCSNK